MKSLGICIGASNVTFALVEKTDRKVMVLQERSVPHEGDPRSRILEYIDRALLQTIDFMAVTGRKLRHIIDAASLAEAEAVEHAYRYIRSFTPPTQANILISAGGENFMVYALDKNGFITNVFTGNKCASGTGEFFLQQIRRMNLNIEEALEIADINHPYKLSGRCSVFSKSDCTHALNKGTDKGKVVAGLCEMMAVKVAELLQKTDSDQILLVGGTSDNHLMIDYLQQKMAPATIIVPHHARNFEALGAALWALEEEHPSSRDTVNLFHERNTTFSLLPPLKNSLDMVSFKQWGRKTAQNGDRCILGLDVGSTTTKAVLIREDDQRILASSYLRTSGDPVGAARQCYRELSQQIPDNIFIIGLGVTGSGRQIAALHALTPAVINEIVAHATAAVFFDAEVDTIFEIGGQDAKYTYITNGVPSDYAMNEACSAGTGSFLEESAWESLGIPVQNIADIAFSGSQAPNFNDQCAAFIGSDIKSAIQEGIEIPDIVAGLVYSICTNYNQRVKGSRKIGEKIFMQGGVCYNQAVPAAMAALTGKKIVVPPEPGLMGAFGVALQVREQLKLNQIKPQNFHLKELIEREVLYQQPFICKGGKEKCDRSCKISRVQIDGRIYPFGGACNKYVNLIHDPKPASAVAVNLVNKREDMLYDQFSRKFAVPLQKKLDKTMGIIPSLQTASLYPLYYNFFAALGFDIITADHIDEDGVHCKGSSYCYPVEISHGFLSNLMKKNPDYYFLPHVKYMPVEQETKKKTTCPFVQGEPYYLQSAFSQIPKDKIVSAVLEMNQGYHNALNTFIAIGKKLGFSAALTRKAFYKAVEAQDLFQQKGQELGRIFLGELEQNPDEIAIVIVGRSYNALSKYAHMGIPQKFSSRKYKIIPYDFLPCAQEEITDNMYWASGNLILKASSFIKNHPQLFPVYISNFSCGPDSFLISYFRKILGSKPSLTLELDSHTADAGLDTRIEAFIDVIHNYLKVNQSSAGAAPDKPRLAEIIMQEQSVYYCDSNGHKYPLNHAKNELLIPSMGQFGSELLAATFRSFGIRARALPEPRDEEFKLGQGYASCKECLPLILTLGSMIKFLNENEHRDKNMIYFMPQTSGPCRFGQYNTLMKHYLEDHKIYNLALLSLTSDNSYAGFGNKMGLKAWQAVIVSDVMEEIYSAVLVLAANPDQAISVYDGMKMDLIQAFEKQEWSGIKQTIQQNVKRLQSIPKKKSLAEVPKAALIGEIYVRRDNFSRQNVLEKLAAKNILLKTAPIAEWLYYIDNLCKNNHLGDAGIQDRIKTYMNVFFKTRYEKEIKQLFAQSGFYEYHLLDMERIVRNGSKLLSPKLTGETILTVGAAITEIIEDVSGVISIGPFGCMPNRMAEALINDNISRIKPDIAQNKELVNQVLHQYPALPFLSIETDGSMFPQIIEARLETFCLQVERLHQKVQAYTKPGVSAK